MSESADNAHEAAGEIAAAHRQAAEKLVEIQRTVNDARREADRVRDESERYFEAEHLKHRRR